MCGLTGFWQAGGCSPVNDSELSLFVIPDTNGNPEHLLGKTGYPHSRV